MPKFHCNHCGQRIEVREVYAGQTFACPTCSGLLCVPQAASPDAGNPIEKKAFSIGDFYFSFNGRISVADYWIKGVLVFLPLGFLALWADANLNAGGFIYIGFMLFSIWAGAALLVKRWHDRDKSGWFYWVILIPLVGPIWTLIEAGCMEGTKGENRYGPDPIRRKKRR
jgi:uncharacterized membrane protein YhaH (DUF805 family)